MLKDEEKLRDLKNTGLHLTFLHTHTHTHSHIINRPSIKVACVSNPENKADGIEWAVVIAEQ